MGELKADYFFQAIRIPALRCERVVSRKIFILHVVLSNHARCRRALAQLLGELEESEGRPVRKMPLVETVAEPIGRPEQVASVVVLMVALKAAAGWVIVTLAVVVQPLASVAVTVYVPAARLIAMSLVCASLHR